MKLGKGAVALGAVSFTGLSAVAAPAALAAAPAAPDTVIGWPRIHDEVYPVRSLTFTGTASDDKAVATVWVAFQDRQTRRWYRPDGTFGAFYRYKARLGTANRKKTTWSYTWRPPVPGSYLIQANAMDKEGHPDAVLPWRRFAADGAAPATRITAPRPANTTRRRGTTTTFAGQATDDNGVRHVQVAIQNRRTGKWLRPGGRWGKIYWHRKQIRRPGALSTGWSFAQKWHWTGTFLVRVRAVDLAGHADGTPADKRVKVIRR